LVFLFYLFLLDLFFDNNRGNKKSGTTINRSDIGFKTLPERNKLEMKINKVVFQFIISKIINNTSVGKMKRFKMKRLIKCIKVSFQYIGGLWCLGDLSARVPEVVAPMHSKNTITKILESTEFSSQYTLF